MPDRIRSDQPGSNHLADLYEHLINRLEDRAIFLLDPEGRMATWNPGVEKLLGYSESEWVSESCDVIFTPEDRAAGEVERELRTAVDRGRAAKVRWHLCKDGRSICVDGVLTALRDDAGQLLGFGKVMRDATGQQRAQEALGASEERNRLERERLAQVFEQAPVAICVLRGRDLCMSWRTGRTRSCCRTRPWWGCLWLR